MFLVMCFENPGNISNRNLLQINKFLKYPLNWLQNYKVPKFYL